MTYLQRLERIANRIDAAVSDLPVIKAVINRDIQELFDMALELDTTPRSTEPNDKGAKLVLIAAFPYCHPEDRETRRLALYDKPCPSGDGSGEFIIWSEVREVDHDGYREAARHNGLYTGYVDDHEWHLTYYQMLDKFSYKCARIVGPFVPEKNRGYRRSN